MTNRQEKEWITIEEYIELMKWIKENCWFYNWERKWKMIKYVENSYDTRDGIVWQVILDHKHFFRDNIIKEVKKFCLNKNNKND